MQSWLRIVLPRGIGSVLVYSLFADESGNPASGLLTVAGYVIGSKQLERFSGQWAEALDRGVLSYFHMKEGHHVSHPDLYAELIGMINPDNMIVGFSASVNEREYD